MKIRILSLAVLVVFGWSVEAMAATPACKAYKQCVQSSAAKKGSCYGHLNTKRKSCKITAKKFYNICTRSANAKRCFEKLCAAKLACFHKAKKKYGFSMKVVARKPTKKYPCSRLIQFKNIKKAIPALRSCGKKAKQDDLICQSKAKQRANICKVDYFKVTNNCDKKAAPAIKKCDSQDKARQVICQKYKRLCR